MATGLTQRTIEGLKNLGRTTVSKTNNPCLDCEEYKRHFGNDTDECACYPVNPHTCVYWLCNDGSCIDPEMADRYAKISNAKPIVRTFTDEAEERFRCPQCGGPHFGSSLVPGKDEEDRVYCCHGYEVQFRDHKNFPGWRSCGWRGSRAECMSKENQ